MAVQVFATSITVADFLIPIPSGCLLAATAVLSPDLFSKPHVPAPSPCPHWQTQISGWGTQRCGMDHLCRSHPVLPDTPVAALSSDKLHSPPITPKDPFLYQLIFSLVRGLPRMQEPLLSFSSPPGAQVSPASFPLPFPFFFLSSCLVMQGYFLSF